MDNEKNNTTDPDRAVKEKYAELLGVAHKVLLALEQAEDLYGQWRELLSEATSTQSEIVAQSFRPFIEKGLVPGAYFKIENSDKIYQITQIRHLAYGVIDITAPDKTINAQLSTAAGSTIDRFILLPDYQPAAANAPAESEGGGDE